MTGTDELGEHSSSDGDFSVHAWAAQQAKLVDRDRTSAEERVDRLAGDRDLAAALRWANMAANRSRLSSSSSRRLITGVPSLFSSPRRSWPP